jgi:hypothetical protein
MHAASTEHRGQMVAKELVNLVRESPRVPTETSQRFIHV